MPPHCDSVDGPVVTAARHALDAVDVDLVLPYVAPRFEAAVREAFELATKVRVLGPEARTVADRWFFETAVRVHRAGEGAPFTGLKPAGLDVGPIIPAAERAIASGSAAELLAVLSASLGTQVERRLGEAIALKEHVGEGVAEARAYVDAVLGLQVWAHRLHQQITADRHEHLVGCEHD